MEIEKTLRPCRRRLTSEAALRALCLSLIIGAAAAAVPGMLRLFRPELGARLPVLLTFLAAAGLAFIVSFILLRPTWRETARRLDGAGLSDRVTTMLEYRDDPSPIAGAQRADALAHVRALPLPAVRITAGRRITAAAAVLCTAVFVLTLMPGAKPELPEETLIGGDGIDQLIDGMREAIDDGQAGQQVSGEMMEITDELREALENAQNAAAQRESMDRASDAFRQSAEGTQSRKPIGDAMKEQEDLSSLGDAISEGDSGKVSEAMDDLRQKTAGDPSVAQSLSEQLREALDKAGESGDSLSDALEEIQKQLADPNGNHQAALDQGESDINEALQEQQNAQKLAAQLQQMMDAVQAASDPNAQTPGPMQGGEAPGQQQGQKSGQTSGQQGGRQQDGGQDPQDSHGSAYDPGGAAQDSRLTASVYDPARGELVPYGDVYAAYYASFLGSVGERQMPDDVIDAMNRYMDGLRTGGTGN